MTLGGVGIWTAQLDSRPASEAREIAAELEELGYEAVWVPEVMLRDAFGNAMLLLDATDRLVVGTGIAVIWYRVAQAAAMAHRTVSEAHPGRFVLGLGVSHAPLVEGFLSRPYEKPYTAMSEYLDGMDNAMVLSPEPDPPAQRVLGALGPRMLALARDKASGAHPYNVTPDHTAFAREVLGPDRLLAPEQAVVLETDADAARAAGRQHLAIYLDLPNYVNNLRRFGFDDDDFADGGSDRLVDALVAWGDLDRIRARVDEHREAGADHVAVQVLGDLTVPPLDEWRRLAPALT